MAGEHTTRMYQEAAEAPARIAEQLARNTEGLRALGARLRRLAPHSVITCARGSSDHAASYAKYLFETGLGILTASAAPSVTSVYGARLRMPGSLFVAISQSGRSPDIIATTAAARRSGALTVALVNDTSSPLALAADQVIALHAGPELSVAATKSCLAAFAAIAQLYAHWRDDAAMTAALSDLPPQLDQAFRLDWGAARQTLARATDLYVVGRGLGLAAAQEAALKLKETCAVHAEAISAAELRHGPMALVRDQFPVLILSQNDPTRPGIVELCQRLAASGAALFIAGFTQQGSGSLPTLAVPPALAPMTMLMSFYSLANDVALMRGLDPDSPPHLKKITETV